MMLHPNNDDFKQGAGTREDVRLFDLPDVIGNPERQQNQS